jgi:hypothetical protein
MADVVALVLIVMELAAAAAGAGVWPTRRIVTSPDTADRPAGSPANEAR